MMDWQDLKLCIVSAIHEFMDSGVWSYLEAPRITISPRLFIDGDQWCALYGESLMEGVAGFGNTPNEALSNFSKEMNKSLREAKK